VIHVTNADCLQISTLHRKSTDFSAEDLFFYKKSDKVWSSFHSSMAPIKIAQHKSSLPWKRWTCYDV